MSKKQAWEVVIKDRFLNSDKKENPFIMAFLYFVIVLLSFLLIFIVFFQLCLIIGDSMNPSLYNNEHVLLRKSNNYIDFGDVVVITKADSKGNPTNIIKRVIGVAGDELDFRTESGKINLYRKSAGSTVFILLNESYIKPNEKMQLNSDWVYAKPDSGPIKIQDDFIFVMGDNRNNSLDSRKDGQYTLSAVYGEMIIKVEQNTFLEFLLKILYNDQKSITEDS